MDGDQALKEILDQHRDWVTSSGKEGKRLDLSGAFLPGVNLAGANLSGANCSGIDLANAKLNKARLQDAHLQQTDLEDAHWGWSTLMKVGKKAGLKPTWEQDR
jgi:uncharacterized protein YjbI with pentapeptide repeats